MGIKFYHNEHQNSHEHHVRIIEDSDKRGSRMYYTVAMKFNYYQL